MRRDTLLAQRSKKSCVPSKTHNLTGSYTTARVVGITNRDLTNHITDTASAVYIFTAWGRVNRLDSDTFELDDGSKTPIRVVSFGHGLSTGDYACARGIWQMSVTPHTLICPATSVLKIN